MKNFILLSAMVTSLASCGRFNDTDLKTGTYKLFSPISINGELLDKDYWTITEDSLYITRGSELIYHDRIVWYGNNVDLFPFQKNPYYGQSMSGGKIVTVSWGFYYTPEGVNKFTLQREY